MKLPIFTWGKTREEQGNKNHIDVGKDKGKTEKHYPYSQRERQGKDRETKGTLIQGKIREKWKNITHTYIGKDKGSTEKLKPY